MEKADKLFKNANIYTIDDSNPHADTIAVKDETIMYVGKFDDMPDIINDKTEIYDLDGKTMLPGLIEPHVHIPGNAYNVLYNINLYDCKDTDDIMNTIETFVKENPNRDSYYGRGFVMSAFPPPENAKGPRSDRLDAICSDKPIILTDSGGHIFWLNSKAFEMANITEETEPVEGGVIEKDPETGQLWGTLKEEAKNMVGEVEFTLDEKVKAIEWWQDYFISLGITSVMTMRQGGSVDPVPIFDALESLNKKGSLKIRVKGAREIKANQPVDDQIQDLVELSEKYNTKMLKAITAKFFIDGTVEGVSAWLKEPYLESAGKGDKYFGESLWKEKDLTNAFIDVLAKGFNIHVHAIGDAAVEMTVNALERAQSEVKKDHRNTITHLQIVRQEEIRRMAKADIIACVNAFWHFKDPSVYFDAELPFLGDERAENEYPLRKFIESGVRITCSADYPVSPDPDPFKAVQCGVTRNIFSPEQYWVKPINDPDDPKWLLNKEERVSVEDMLRAYTINAAYAMYSDDTIGSLKNGKFADMIVIDRDIYKTEPLEIEKTKVLKTIIGGNICYSV